MSQKKTKSAIKDDKQQPNSSSEMSEISEFDTAMRGIVGTPKAEVEKAEQKERDKKEKNGQK